MSGRLILAYSATAFDAPLHKGSGYKVCSCNYCLSGVTTAVYDSRVTYFSIEQNSDLQHMIAASEKPATAGSGQWVVCDAEPACIMRTGSGCGMHINAYFWVVKCT
jgi:hypothetical protein